MQWSNGCTWTFEFLFWVEKYTQIPEDDEEAYVVSYEMSYAKVIQPK